MMEGSALARRRQVVGRDAAALSILTVVDPTVPAIYDAWARGFRQWANRC